MTPARRKWVLGLALVATLVLVWLAPEEEAPPSRSAVAKAQQAKIQAARSSAIVMNDGQLESAVRPKAGEVVDLFKSRTWYIPPPPVEEPKGPPPPPPVPTAPPLPFAFMGQVIEDQQVQVVLTRSNRVVTVREGEMIDRNYRLESFHDGILTFVYLPLDIKQTLVIGEAP